MCGSSLATSVILKQQHVWLRWVTLPRCNSLMSWAATASCTCSSLLILGPHSHVQSFETQFAVQMSISTPFQKKKIPVHITQLKTHIPCSFICTGMVCHCKQEADCILVYATALQRIYLDNLAAKHRKHLNLSLSSITLLWMSTWGFLNKITVYVWTGA